MRLRNAPLLILLATVTACSPKSAADPVQVYSLELDKKYPNSAYLIASSAAETAHEPAVYASKSFTPGKEKTVYVNQPLLTVSNQKEQKISLPYVKANKSAKLGYEIPKSFKELKEGKKTNKVRFVEVDKNLIYPLQILKQLPNEYYLPQEEIVIDKKITASKTKSSPVEVKNAAKSPAYFVLVGDVYIGLTADLKLAHSYYLRSGLEYIHISIEDSQLALSFKQIEKTKKSALSEKNYSIVYLGKNGNTLQFRKVYNNSDKAAETREVKMSSPQIEVFGHSILVQTATREALHCVIQK